MAETGIRRKRVFLFFLVIAAVGGVIKVFAEPRSAASEAATILLTVWIIPAGWFVVYFAKKSRLVPMGAFDGRVPFVPHVAVDLALRPEQNGLGALRMGKEHRAIFVVGTQGFTARFILPPESPLQAGAPLRVQAQFLRPEVALPHFGAGSAFTVIEGHHTVGAGEVVKVLCAV